MLRPFALDVLNLDPIQDDSVLSWLPRRSVAPITRRNSKEIMDQRTPLDGTFTAKSATPSDDSLEKAALNVDSILTPTPIDVNRARFRPELPISESNIIAEGADFIDSVISILSSRVSSESKRRNEEISSHHLLSSSQFLSLKKEVDASATKKRRPTPVTGQPAVRDKPGSNVSESPSSHLSDDSAGSVCSTGSSNTNKKQSFRSYQTALWDQRFKELAAYVRQHGNCLVPNDWKWNPSLSKWVKRQRYQYRLKLEGKHTTLTPDRQTALERLGFIWDPHKAVWEEHFQELRAFKLKHGHCNVPSNYSENYSLSVWVQCQRRQYKLYCRTRPQGKAKGMDEDRIVKLQELGFVWDPQNRESGGGDNSGGADQQQEQQQHQQQPN